MKTCTKCDESKPLDAFYQNPECRDGRQGSCKECDNKRSIAWKKANVESTKMTSKRYYLKVKYGLTMEQYDALLSAQGGCCACCGSDSVRGRGVYFPVDHDHETGAVRGLLCNPCNVGIGALGDCAEGVARALAYLERTR